MNVKKIIKNILIISLIMIMINMFLYIKPIASLGAEKSNPILNYLYSVDDSADSIYYNESNETLKEGYGVREQ